jgi:hypothetical protein
VTFTLWVLFPNVISPSDPTGTSGLVTGHPYTAVSYSLPVVTIATNVSSLVAVSGPWLRQCPGFSAPGGEFIPAQPAQPSLVAC